MGGHTLYLGVEPIKFLDEFAGGVIQVGAMPRAKVGADVKLAVRGMLKGDDAVVQCHVVNEIFFSLCNAALIADLEDAFIMLNQVEKLCLADVDPKLHAADFELFKQMASAAHKVTQSGRAVDPLVRRFIDLNDPFLHRLSAPINDPPSRFKLQPRPVADSCISNFW
ncbi:MAG: hypothetical protein KBE07_04340 [Rhodoferax sp.]|nr:hypothetical protein [Rhodoferax sp.]